MSGYREVYPSLPIERLIIANTDNIHLLPNGDPITISTPYVWNFVKYPHALLVGGTGSGKTTALKQIIASFSYSIHCEIFLCTFKHKDEDFSFLNVSGHFNYYLKCKDLFAAFYRRFLDRLEGKDSARYLLLLVFDEWVGFLLYLDKQERQEALDKLGQILMMGRSFGVQVMIAIQRPDAQFFGNGARDNFGLVMALGRMSPDGYRMVFPSDYIKEVQACGIGEGYAMIGGMDFNRIRIPPPTPQIDYILQRKIK